MTHEVVRTRRLRLLTAVMALAAVDWAVSVALIGTGTRREVAVPLLIAAAATLVSLQLPRLIRVARFVRAAAPGLRWAAAETALGREWSPLAARLLLREPRLIWSIGLLLTGRRDGRPDPVFAGHQDVLPTWVALGAVAAVEVGVTALLPLPRWLETALLVLGLWGVVVVLGLIAGLVVHPHVVGPDIVRLRIGFWTELIVPRSFITGVHLGLATVERGLHIGDREVTLAPGGSVNLRLALREPVMVNGEEVLSIRCWADRPAALRAELLRTGPRECLR